VRRASLAALQPSDQPFRATRPAANRIALFAILAAAASSSFIAWSSSESIEILWDEQVDHDIAVGLRDHPLAGRRPTLDGSQMRLPMYVNAAVFAMTGRDDLATMRAVSIAFAAFTILATGGLARALFGSLVGALSAWLVGISPYFLAYARIAMTEGDVFVACFYTLAVWAFVAFQDRPTGRRWALVAVLTGLAVGSKLHGLALLPSFMLLAVLRSRDPAPPAANPDPRQHRNLRRGLATGAALLVCSLLPGIAAHGGLLAAEAARDAAFVGWILLCGAWVAILAWSVRLPAVSPRRITTLAGLFVFAGITLAVWMPVHVLNDDIPRSIARRLLRWDDRVPLAIGVDHLRLYSGIILIKATVPIGLAIVAGLLAAIARSPKDPRWRVLAACTVPFIAGLCLLPLRQTFHLMGIYPLMMIAAAACLVETGRRIARRGRSVRWAGGLLVAAMLANLGWSVARSYPHFHLAGYDLIGDHWLWAESRGYRNLIQTPSDGVVSLVRWCDENAPPGSRVVSFLWEDHIVERVRSDRPGYEFVPRGLRPDSDVIPDPPSLIDADYVLLHINNRLGYGDRPPDWPTDVDSPDRFAAVFTVRRAGLEVAWVFAAAPASP